MADSMASSSLPARPDSNTDSSPSSGMGTSTIRSAPRTPAGGTRRFDGAGSKLGSVSHQRANSSNDCGHWEGSPPKRTGALGASSGNSTGASRAKGFFAAAPSACSCASQTCGSSINAWSTPASRHQSSALAIRSRGLMLSSVCNVISTLSNPVLTLPLGSFKALFAMCT